MITSQSYLKLQTAETQLAGRPQSEGLMQSARSHYIDKLSSGNLSLLRNSQNAAGWGLSLPASDSGAPFTKGRVRRHLDCQHFGLSQQGAGVLDGGGGVPARHCAGVLWTFGVAALPDGLEELLSSGGPLLYTEHLFPQVSEAGSGMFASNLSERAAN